MRRIYFEPGALQDIAWWVANDRRIALKVIDLIEEIAKTPFEGRDKPEPLKHQFSGAWSRRITQEHRLIYTVTDTEITVLMCRFHYSKGS